MLLKNKIIGYWKGRIVSNPKVSIITPTYNRPKLLQKAIESVLAQTFPEFEMLIVNDGWVDVSEVVNQYRDKRLRYLSKPHGGLSSACNEGIRNAKGKYIAYIDDDLFEPNHLEVTVKELDKEEVDFVYAICNVIQENGNLILTYNCRFNSEILMLERNFIPVCSAVHRGGLVESCGMFDESLLSHMDWDMWKKFVKNGVKFKYIPIPTSYYVIHGNNKLKFNTERNNKEKEIVRRRL